KVYTYEAYYSNTDLKAKVTEENTDYPGTVYYYYDSYSDGNANEIGYKKIDSNSGQELDYKQRNGQSTIYYKKDPDASEYWYLWDMPVDSNVWPSLPGWSMLAKQDPNGNWYVYPFDPNSNVNDPVVSWSSWDHAIALNPSGQEAFSLPAWPPADVDYPTEGVLQSLIVSEEFNLMNEETTSSHIDISYFLDRIEDLKSVSTGDGVTVALLDTGLNKDKIDTNAMITGYDFAGTNRFDGVYDEDYTDVIGHGTEVAAVIRNEKGEGIAPEADLMALKIFDDSKSTSSSIVANALRYAIDKGASIVAMPFSLFPIYDQVKDAIDYAVGKGAILIAAAGNNASEIPDNSLASYESIITVGSVDPDGKISAWSNYGSEIDLYAPWWDVVTFEDWGSQAGTSFSTAFVAGITALMLSDNPDMTKDDVLDQFKEMSVNPVQNNIKGVNVNEVLSKYEIERENRTEFNGYPIVKESYNNLELQ
ncbi:MAG: S8 family serine peptidase, partial [Candidatus Omnitrophota bacterium]